MSIKNRISSQYIWNLAAGSLNAAESVIIGFLVMRYSDLETAGMFTIAFAVGNLMICIGKFGVRNIQASDVDHTFSYTDYFTARIFSILLMLVSLFLYLSIGLLVLHYSGKKLTIIAMICIIYSIESYEDLIWGEYQRQGHIEIGAKLFILRWGSILGLFCVFLIFSKNAVVSLLSALALSLLIYFARLSYWEKSLVQKKAAPSIKSKAVLRAALPVFSVTFLNFFLNNLPKYSIDIWYNDIMQADYGFIAMPVFAVGLLCSFIYQPKIKTLGDMFANKNFYDLQAEIKGMLIRILFISLFCFAGAFFLGIPVLSLLYATDLTRYKTDFMILMIASGLMAYVNYFNVVLVVVRQQQKMFYGYLITVLAAAMILPASVKRSGIQGASVSYTMILFLQFIILFLITYRSIWRATYYEG